MAVRLAYAVAFRAVREVLILDEVFAVGDFGFRQACHQRFRKLHQQGHSMVLVSHDPNEISRFCDRALLLEGGRIVAEGTGPEIAEAYRAGSPASAMSTLLLRSPPRPQLAPAADVVAAPGGFEVRGTAPLIVAAPA